MSGSITLLTKDEARAIAEQAALRAAELVKDYDRFPEVMDKKTVAKYLVVSIPTINRKMREGMPVTYRVGDPRFLKSEIDAWLKS